MVENSVSQIEKLPPQSLESEQAVLGALLVNPVCITSLVEVLKPEYFYKQAHKLIYSTILELFSNNEPVDVVTVSESLRDSGKLENVGGRSYINDLALSVVTTANSDYYANLIADKSILRDLIAAGSNIVSQAYQETDTSKVLDTAEQAIFAIAQRKVAEDLVHVKDIVVESYDMIEKRYKNRDNLTGLSSGFYDLDSMTAGFQSSDLIILAARPSMGKTAFCLNIAQSVGIDQKKSVAIFSLEMSKEQLVQRMLCSEAEIDSNRLRTGHMQFDDWNKLASAMGKLADSPIFIDDSPGATVMDLRAKCRRLCMEQKDMGMIIIDYLQLMEGTGSKDRVQEISKISRGLKGLARELKVPVIALSQLSRAVESRTDKRPMLSDLRESGSIEQDADIVMFIYRDEYYNPESAENNNKGKAEIIIAKQRNGPVGKVDLLFHNHITKFKNPAKNTEVF